MKQTLYLLVFCVFTTISFNSCSKDDEGNEPQLTKLVDKITVKNTTDDEIVTTYTFEYYQDFSVKSINKVSLISNDTYKTIFDYSPNVTKADIVYPQSGAQIQLEIEHQNGIMSKYTYVGVGSQDITYNPQTEVYSLNFNNNFQQLFWFDQYHNLSTNSAFSFEYDNSKKGAMFNVPNPNKTMHFFANYFGSMDFIYFLTSKPVTALNNSTIDNTDTCLNEYDSEGYLVQSLISDNVNNRMFTYEFSYTLK